MRQGFIADICSTDLVLGSMFRRPVFSLPNLMFRYICMGIPMRQVVGMATENPSSLMDQTGSKAGGEQSSLPLENRNT